MSTRSVGSTHTSRVDSGFSSSKLYKCSRRMHDARSVTEGPFHRPRVALKTLYVFICFPTHPFSGECWLIGFAQVPCTLTPPPTRHSHQWFAPSFQWTSIARHTQHPLLTRPPSDVPIPEQPVPHFPSKPITHFCSPVSSTTTTTRTVHITSLPISPATLVDRCLRCLGTHRCCNSRGGDAVPATADPTHQPYPTHPPVVTPANEYLPQQQEGTCVTKERNAKSKTCVRLPPRLPVAVLPRPLSFSALAAPSSSW